MQEWTRCRANNGLSKLSIFMLTDSSDRIQALAAVMQEVDRLFVETLLSAAWNVPLPESYNNPEDQQKIVKGAGTTMMLHIYECARKKNLAKVALISTLASSSFYANHLKMQPGTGPLSFFISV